MLRRLDLKRPWRSLDKGFWPDDVPLGCRAIVYGHNGSGKSTLSELLLSLAEGASATEVVWESEDKQRSTVEIGGASPSASIAVFTRKWVEANLSDFFAGAGTSAIVTLGREVIVAKEEEERLVDEIERLTEEISKAEKQRKDVDDAVAKLARDVQEQIVSELSEFDHSHFTRSRYSITKVQGDLRAYKSDVPDSNDHVKALKCLGEGAPAPVPEIAAPPVSIAGALTNLAELFVETPSRVAVQALEGKPIAQDWVERGLKLHDGLDHCLFCASEITEQRRVQLIQHFDASWLQIRRKAEGLLAVVRSQKQELTDWHRALPATACIAGELQFMYEEALKRAQLEVDHRLATLDSVEVALRAKAADPSAIPEAADCSVLSSVPSVTALAQEIAKHNDQARRHEEVTTRRKQTVLDHLLGSHSEAFRKLEAQTKSLAIQAATSKTAARSAERRLEEVRQAHFTTKDMADTLTRDLARVYGKDHLSVVVMEDGKSYACRRGNKPGTNLSDGERTTLSLLYFLRKLEDKRVSSSTHSERIVVIDDPSSSLDREAVFATHQWLIDRLGEVGQYIILTHDFSLLRLFMKSQKNAWQTSLSKIKKGDADEMRFPKVSFLELFAASGPGGRRSRVGRLPRLLLNHTSEYAYLFSMVMAGIADSEDHERLFLLPNATRRVLEVFASYKAPHCTDFRAQLELLITAQEGEPFRDVYDFCNRFSHGEGSESVDVLDARAVQGQIRRCMEFLQAADGEHFQRMCAATGADASIIARAPTGY